PEEVQIDQVKTESGQTQKIKSIKRVIKKRKGPKKEVTEITTIEKEGEEPVTSVVVKEETAPDFEEIPEVQQVLELPEETKEEEVPSDDGKPRKIKTSKRIIKKKSGPKLETTEITTTQLDDNQPIITVHTTEETLDDTTSPLDTLPETRNAKVIEEEPEEVQIDQVKTESGETQKIKTIKRVIKKRKGPKN
ncbi:PREDICTED: enolase-phosphatase E1-like, partial [Papilio polytes]|uniref:enolase-phosphatase E1-like n=1 Tax=Papilio polytes TaxID=76194 RepID=UPI0006760493